MLDANMLGFCACERGKAADELKLDPGCRRIYLQVNKNSRSAIETELSHGFRIAESARLDSGGGFVMDDYVMHREV